MKVNRLGRDISVLADQLEVPGIGFLAVNAFVLHASEPVVVDTGLSLPGRGFLDVGHVAAADLRAGQLLWASVDSPWVHTVDAARYHATFAPLQDISPALILSTHLPPAVRRAPEFLQMLADAPAADAFVGPDQSALEQMLAGFEPSQAVGSRHARAAG
jgi:hypothetical protein